MEKLFGTDGIRGVANQHPMTPEMALKTGRAVAAYFLNRSNSKRRKIIIGKDTRLSGDMLESALAAGISAMGVDVYLAGVLPTPGIARLAADMGFIAGIVISASHNPYYDNGIKLFKADGFKLSDDQEREIERLIHDGNLKENAPSGSGIGRIFPMEDAADRYLSFLVDTKDAAADFSRFSVVLDCANGATYQVASRLFEAFGAAVATCFNTPDGENINANCGSQHPETLAQTVVDRRADVGLAFDGDGDRLIVVDETGAVLSGDQIIAVCAKHMKSRGTLKGNRVVSTVMSNMGFKQALRKMGIEHRESQVGDRYVMEEMQACGAVLGGEDSGHIIFLDDHSTGDGLLAATRLLTAMADDSRPLSRLAGVMTVFPQVLINVDVGSKPELETLPEVVAAISESEQRIGTQGRVLVRYSGTQPQCRVMVESSEMGGANEACARIADAIRKCIGKQ